MPRMTDDSCMNLPIKGSSYNFSAVRPEQMAEDAGEYTLVTLVVDVSYSVVDFVHELQKGLKTVVKSCQNDPRAANLAFRFVTFNRRVNEVHGFVPIAQVDPDSYGQLRPSGTTALFDASHSAVGATGIYGKALYDQDLDVNGIIVVITDGEDNESSNTAASVGKAIQAINKAEGGVESIFTILVGLTNGSNDLSTYLEDFKNQAGFDQYIDVNEFDEDAFLRLSGFISKSISAASQSLGSGGKSQPLTF